MRIVHTSDWHAGRVWKNVNRIDELNAVLEHLAGFVERERIDILLVSGDVFDTGAPAAEAERCVFRFLKRVGTSGAQTVLIAGNHDSPARLDAWGTLAELVGVRVVGRPRRASDGGVIELGARSGEKAVIAAIPFAAPRYLVSALELAAGETGAKQRYAEGLKGMVEQLCRAYRTDAVNLLVSHTHLEGAAYSGSERTVHLGDEWAAAPQSLPSGAHYVALGHIHRPQQVKASPSPAYYAGSPLQLDFGEEGESKVFMFVEARPGKPARVEPVPYEGGRPLLTLRKTLAEVEQEADALREQGWLRIVVPLATPDPDINGKVRRLLGNALAVQVELPKRDEEKDDQRPPQGASPQELYRAYCVKTHRAEPEAPVTEAFAELLQNAEEV